ncbi:MAG: STAS domain-containing protein [Methylococcaceae bacterium]|nr:STAS domain-containing protein [Methylococcaceae bacterium]
MSIHSHIANQKATVTLVGRFDFTLHKEFRESTQRLLQENDLTEIEINLRDVDYLDSSALGILLLLKDRASQKGASIAITGCRENIRQILEIANFNKLFSIS